MSDTYSVIYSTEALDDDAMTVSIARIVFAG